MLIERLGTEAEIAGGEDVVAAQVGLADHHRRFALLKDKRTHRLGGVEQIPAVVVQPWRDQDFGGAFVEVRLTVFEAVVGHQGVGGVFQVGRYHQDVRIDIQRAAFFVFLAFHRCAHCAIGCLRGGLSSDTEGQAEFIADTGVTLRLIIIIMVIVIGGKRIHKHTPDR